MTDYRIESFAPALSEEGPTPQSAAFTHAVRSGFYDAEPDAEALERSLRLAQEDGRVFTAAYALRSPAYALATEVPVATYASLAKRINVGFGAQLGAHLITSVTVRPTHRRRGLLRRLIGEDLRRAADSGAPLAALTASEGSIYRRFGFGPAEWQAGIELDTGEGLAFVGEPSGRVESAPASVLAELGPEIYSRFQARVPGALERIAVYWAIASGAQDRETGKPDPAVRAALHYDSQGRPDGYVSYRFKGWQTSPYTVEVLDLIAEEDEAYRQLWHFLGSLDLVSRVRFDAAAKDSPLPWLLADPRRARMTSSEDGVWLRILDVAAAFERRGWGSAEGELRLHVVDDLGIAEGGYRLQVSGGRAEVTPLAPAEDADLAMGVSELSSIYLGGADPALLVRAGRIAELVPGAAARARALLALERAPYAPSHF